MILWSNFVAEYSISLDLFEVFFLNHWHVLINALKQWSTLYYKVYKEVDWSNIDSRKKEQEHFKEADRILELMLLVILCKWVNQNEILESKIEVDQENEWFFFEFLFR